MRMSVIALPVTFEAPKSRPAASSSVAIRPWRGGVAILPVPFGMGLVTVLVRFALPWYASIRQHSASATYSNHMQAHAESVANAAGGRGVLTWGHGAAGRHRGGCGHAPFRPAALLGLRGGHRVPDGSGIRA